MITPPTPGSLAVIAGSGMDAVANGLDVTESIPFESIEGVGTCTVKGHRGEVRFCRTGRGEVVIVLGRRHLYEGTAAAMRALIAWLARRGVTDLLICSAAGALTTALVPGELVLARGIVDTQNRRDPARTPPDEGPCDRPVGRTMFDPDLCQEVEAAAARAGVVLRRGTIVCGAGPTYETPAEVRWLQTIGADLATMSAAPEVDCAARLGLRSAVIAAVTNPATGISHSVPGHEEVVEQAGQVTAVLGRIISQLFIK